MIKGVWFDVKGDFIPGVIFPLFFFSNHLRLFPWLLFYAFTKTLGYSASSSVLSEINHVKMDPEQCFL